MTETAMVSLRVLILVVMLAAVLGKLWQRDGLDEFTEWVAGLGLVPRSWSPLVARATVGAEAATAVMVLLPWTLPAALALAGLTFGIFTVGTWLVVRRGTQALCYCFGPSAVRLATRHVVRDGTLAVAAAAGLAGTGLSLPSVAGSLLGAAAGGLLALGALRLDDIASLLV